VVVVVGREFVHPLPVWLAIVGGRSQVGPRQSLRNGAYTCRAVDVAQSVFDQNPDTATAHDLAAHRNAADDVDGSVSLAAQDPHNVIGGHDFPDVQSLAQSVLDLEFRAVHLPLPFSVLRSRGSGCVWL